MRWIRSEDVADAAEAVRNKIVALTHNNEKHVNDFSSDSTLDVIDIKSEKQVKGATKSSKSVSLPAFSKSKSSKETEGNMMGIDPIVKTFYEGSKSHDGYYEWCEIPPRQMSKKQALKADRVAIKLYKVKDNAKPVVNGRFVLKNHMLEIQNPTLIAALKPILKKQDVHLDASEIAKFTEPFRALYFSADEISDLYNATPGADPLKQQLLLLIRVLGEVFGNLKSQIRQLQASGLMTFKNAWIYFPKNCIVYRPGKDTERIFKIVDTKYETKPRLHLSIKAKEIQFDGTTYNWTTTEYPVLPWEGNKPIVEVPMFPLEFHPEAAEIKRRMTERGRKVLDYQGLSYNTYTGVAFYEDDKGMEKHNVDGRILIDIYGYNKHHVSLNRLGGKDLDAARNRIEPISCIPPLHQLLQPGPPSLPPTQIHIQRADEDTETDSDSEDDSPIPRKDEKKSFYIKRLTPEDIETNKQTMLSHEADLIYLSPMLRGYALKNKLWLQFYVDDVQPVVWNDEAFDHLVYPEEQKDLVLSFVENHQSTRQAGIEMDDVIKGKGQGLVLLLSGPPGTGKTLMAEGAADQTRRPLYYLQAEDLGINASVLGANLKKVFEMATEWDAVILLDEADVFMAERNPQDIARNELVSIFLRELEYFRGIIFLTTNLYNTIDTAFRSRVNIHLLFNPLSPVSRLILWRKFLERLPPMKQQPALNDPGNPQGEQAEEKSTRALDYLAQEDLQELAQWELNGREIKNAIKTVKSWCDAKAYEMTLSRLESGIKVTAPNSSKRGVADTSLYDD